MEEDKMRWCRDSRENRRMETCRDKTRWCSQFCVSVVGCDLSRERREQAMQISCWGDWERERGERLRARQRRPSPDYWPDECCWYVCAI